MDLKFSPPSTPKKLKKLVKNYKSLSMYVPNSKMPISNTKPKLVENGNLLPTLFL
jgi:hypothetical protein